MTADTGKAKRKPHKKSKTGCLTCKARRIKCTEERPSCMRCIKVGRVCQGYPVDTQDDPIQDSMNTLFMSGGGPPPPLSAYYGDVDFSSLELQSLEFFHVKTLPGLCGFFDSGFWRQSLLQLSNTEPALRCAMMAIGSAQCDNERIGLRALDLPDAITNVKHEAFTLYQYTKAISLVQRRLCSQGGDRIVSLVACTLFICLELIRGQKRTALAHLKCGLGMLNAAGASLEASHTVHLPSTSPLETIENEVTPILARLSLHHTIQRQPRSGIFVGTMNINSPFHGSSSDGPFDTLEQARTADLNLSNATVRFCYMVLADMFPDKNSIEAFRTGLLERLQQWSVAFEAFMSYEAFSNGELDSADMRGPASLRINNVHSCAWVKLIAFPLNEMDTDKYFDEFRLITTMTEKIIAVTERDCPEQIGIAGFSLDHNITASLGFVGLKCRDRSLRRRAIACMYKGPWRREGLCDAVTAAKGCELHMRVEESYCDPDTEDALPPYHGRVMDFEMQLRDPKDPNRQFVTLLLPPSQPGEGPTRREECLYFDDAGGSTLVDFQQQDLTSSTEHDTFTPATQSHSPSSPLLTDSQPSDMQPPDNPNYAWSAYTYAPTSSYASTSFAPASDMMEYQQPDPFTPSYAAHTFDTPNPLMADGPLCGILDETLPDFDYLAYSGASLGTSVSIDPVS